ncbi:MAG: hypothetical protein P4L51_22720 [Puia sp.]|nr:hypothetical protein [Puia sp.]
MTVYLIKEKDEILIHEISPDQERRFLALYGEKILLVGNCVPDVLWRFSELLVVNCNDY